MTRDLVLDTVQTRLFLLKFQKKRKIYMDLLVRLVVLAE